MKTFSFHDIDNILKRKESYYKGLLKGSHHDKKVATYALQVLSSLRKDFEKSYQEK
jgi:hypothetical protein